IITTENAKVMDLQRLSNSTIFLNSGVASYRKSLGNLKDGTYIYVFERSGKGAVLNRTMDPGPGIPLDSAKSQYIGSHAGLAKLFGYMFRHEPEVVAAGEIIVRNGRVMAINNASGTYR